MTRFILITLSAFLLFSLTAHADPDPSRFERALTTREKIPNRNDLLRLDPQAEKTLQLLLSHSSTPALVRSRAITLLQFFPSKASATALLAVIKTSSQPKAKGLILMDLGRALTSYAVIAGPSSIQQIKPFLTHVNPDVRLEAARALRLSRNEAALPLLENRLKVETTPFVRVQLEKQITQIQRAAAK